MRQCATALRTPPRRTPAEQRMSHCDAEQRDGVVAGERISDDARCAGRCASSLTLAVRICALRFGRAHLRNAPPAADALGALDHAIAQALDRFARPRLAPGALA